MSIQTGEQFTTRSRKPSWRAFLVFVLLASVPVAAMGWRAVRARGARTGGGLPALAVLGQVPEFELTERNGRSFRLSDLRDRVWVADFIFTHCAGPCPLMSAAMSKLQHATADESSVHLVSFSVDPERDTPEVLREYADRYGADPARWHFLTGDRKTIEMLAVQGFKVGDVKDPIYHSTRFILVDGRGRIRGYYDSEETDILQRLAADIRALRGARDW